MEFSSWENGQSKVGFSSITSTGSWLEWWLGVTIPDWLNFSLLVNASELFQTWHTGWSRSCDSGEASTQTIGLSQYLLNEFHPFYSINPSLSSGIACNGSLRCHQTCLENHRTKWRFPAQKAMEVLCSSWSLKTLEGVFHEMISHQEAILWCQLSLILNYAIIMLNPSESWASCQASQNFSFSLRHHQLHGLLDFLHHLGWYSHSNKHYTIIGDLSSQPGLMTAEGNDPFIFHDYPNKKRNNHLNHMKWTINRYF